MTGSPSRPAGAIEKARWLLTAVLLLGHAGMAVAQANYQMTPSGLKYLITEYGRGLQARPGRVMVVHYVGRLRDGTVFDSTWQRKQPVVFRLGRGEVMAGWEEGFNYLHAGGKAVLVVPPGLASGGRLLPNVPAGVQLVFEVELIDVKERLVTDWLEETLAAVGGEETARRFAELSRAGFPGYYAGEESICDLGAKYRRDGKLAEAIAVLTIATQQFPNSGKAFAELGAGQAQGGRKEAAVAALRRAVALEPGNATAVKLLAELTGRQ